MTAILKSICTQPTDVKFFHHTCQWNVVEVCYPWLDWSTTKDGVLQLLAAYRIPASIWYISLPVVATATYLVTCYSDHTQSGVTLSAWVNNIQCKLDFLPDELNYKLDFFSNGSFHPFVIWRCQMFQQQNIWWRFTAIYTQWCYIICFRE